GSEREVLRGWRKCAQPDLDASSCIVRRYQPVPPMSTSLETSLSSLVENRIPTKHVANRIEVAFAADRQIGEHLPVVLEAIADNSSSAIRVRVLSRNLPLSFRAQLQRDFESIEFIYYDLDRVSYGPNIRLLAH